MEVNFLFTSSLKGQISFCVYIPAYVLAHMQDICPRADMQEIRQQIFLCANFSPLLPVFMAVGRWTWRTVATGRQIPASLCLLKRHWKDCRRHLAVWVRQEGLSEDSWVIWGTCLGFHLYYNVTCKDKKGHFQYSLVMSKKILCCLKKLDFARDRTLNPQALESTPAP